MCKCKIICAIKAFYTLAVSTAQYLSLQGLSQHECVKDGKKSPFLSSYGSSTSLSAAESKIDVAILDCLLNVSGNFSIQKDILVR